VSSNGSTGEAPRPQATAQGVRGLLSDKTTITTLALFGFVIIRVLIVARGDVPVALAIVTGVGIATVVVNMIIGSLPFMVAIGITPLLIYLMLGKPDVWRQVLAEATVLILVIILFLTATWQSFLSFLPFPCAVVGFLIYQKRQAPPEASFAWNRLAPLMQRGIAYVTIVIAIESLVLLSAYSPVWLPAEIIRTDSYSYTVGYVLNEQGDWYSILKEDPGIILRIEKTHIKERTICLTRAQARLAKDALPRVIGELLGRANRLAESPCP